jgi:hypothetical protein
MSDPLATLTDVFEDPSTRHGGTADHALPVAVVSWPAVPIEIVRAAGLRAVVVRGDAAPTSAADAWLESNAFPNRLRQLIELVLAGRVRHARCIVLPRTSDADYKAFLYLRELIRRGVTRDSPPVLLFDLLQSNGPDVAAYDAARTRELFHALVRLGGGVATHDYVREAITRTNAARAAMRRLLALRRGEPRVSGSEVLPVLGAFWRLAPGEYATLANAAADLLGRRAPLHGPRVLVLGAPVDGRVLHTAIESLGAVVVGETGPWGCDSPDEDVSPDGDPFFAIAERYRRRAIGPRTPLQTMRRRLERMASDVDAVVVLLTPDDAVFGWDYPALRAWLEARQLPHVCVTGDPCVPPGDEDCERLASLVAAATPRVGTSHG